MSAEFPFIGTTQALSTSNLPLFKMYAWNFDNDRFIRDGNGKMILLEGNPALEVWIIKALKTQRFVYKAYSWRYGSEIKNFLGKVMTYGERYSEMKRGIIETLLVNPYVKSVDSIEFEENEHSREVNVTIKLSTVYGALTV